MKILGIDDKEDVLISEMTYDEFAQFSGFSGEYSLRDKIFIKAGNEIDVGKCYHDAKIALRMHAEAITAAKQLKKTAATFLSFFDKEK